MKKLVILFFSSMILTGCTPKSSIETKPSASDEHVVGQCVQHIFDYQRFFAFQKDFNVLKEKNPRKILTFDFDKADDYTCKYSISVIECGNQHNQIKNQEYEKAWFLFDFEKKHYEEANGAERNLSAKISFYIENIDAIDSFDSTMITYEQKEKDSYTFYYDKTELFNAKTSFGYSRTERDKDSFLHSLTDKAVYLS